MNGEENPPLWVKYLRMLFATFLRRYLQQLMIRYGMHRVRGISFLHNHVAQCLHIPPQTTLVVQMVQMVPRRAASIILPRTTCEVMWLRSLCSMGVLGRLQRGYWPIVQYISVKTSCSGSVVNLYVILFLYKILSISASITVSLMLKQMSLSINNTTNTPTKVNLQGSKHARYFPEDIRDMDKPVIDIQTTIYQIPITISESGLQSSTYLVGPRKLSPLQPQEH